MSCGSAKSRRFEAISRGLCPDPGAQLAAPQGFEGRAFRLTLAFSSRSDLARHRQTLERLLSDPDLDKMFQLA